MTNRRTRSCRRALGLLGLLSAGVPAGCTPRKPAASDSAAARAAAAAAAGATVFTDTALFRQVCAEADSGLTPATARRCTPRDQSLRVLPPPSDTPRRVP